MIDLGASIFAFGQAYVALSTLNGVLTLPSLPGSVEMATTRVSTEYVRLVVLASASLST